jgi:hypothetical protein
VALYHGARSDLRLRTRAVCFQYCDQALCRRHALLAYFGEPKPPSRSAVPAASHSCCDYCAAPARAKEQAALLKSLAQGGGGPRSSLAFTSTETFIRRVKKPEYEDFSGMCEGLRGASAAVAKPCAREEWRVGGAGIHLWEQGASVGRYDLTDGGASDNEYSDAADDDDGASINSLLCAPVICAIAWPVSPPAGPPFPPSPSSERR